MSDQCFDGICVLTRELKKEELSMIVFEVFVNARRAALAEASIATGRKSA